MKDYLLLLRGGDARMAEMSDEETAKHMQDWRAYMGGLAQAGHLTGGLPLQHTGRLLSDNQVTEDMVHSDKGEVIGGYLLFKANDYEQAVDLAQKCPIFENGGNIEIREMMPMEM